MKYIIAIDEGTTSARAMLYDRRRDSIASVCKLPFKQYFPAPGWVEHDAEEIWQKVKRAVKTVTKDIDPKDIYGIGITNQRETIVAWDKRNGKPACKAIVWQCRRTASLCNELKQNKKISKIIKLKTGLTIDAYFSATKIKWLIEHDPNVQELLASHNLMVGTIDSYLTYRLTEGRTFVTDVTNASRTMLFNIHDLDWDPFLLKYFNIPREILPTVVDCCGDYGYTSVVGGKVKICALIGDQQASLVGQGCINKGDIKNTYGTGCFMLLNTGSNIIESKNLVTTVGFKIGKRIAYALEGSVFNAGSAIDWVCKDLKLINNPDKMNELAMSVDDSDGVYMIPAFTGLGCPYWDMEAKGLITGITRGTTIPHIARAIFECIAYSSNDVLRVMEHDSKMQVESISVDGGASKNSFLMQFQADISGKTIETKAIESSCMGVIYLVGLQLGAYKDLEEIASLIKTERIYVSKMPKSTADKKIKGWDKAIKQCINR